MTKKERMFLERQWKRGVPKLQIAKMLRRSHSTICRAINNPKNWDYQRVGKKVIKMYCAEKAQSNFEKNKTKCGAKYKFIKNEKLLRDIEEGVLKGESPDTVIGRLKYQGVKVDITPRTIYNYVGQGISKITPFDLRFKLRRKGHKKKILREHKRKMGKSIELRAETINSRQEFGHWEGDCIVDKEDNAILVLVERMSRWCILRKLEKHESKEVLEKMRTLKEQYFMKSITVDNGSEFYKITQLEYENFEVYFTRPYSSFEKGSVENLNGVIRRYIPKGTNLASLSSETIERIQNQINNWPRKILGYMTASEKFDELKQVC